MQIGIFYGSTGGATAHVARLIEAHIADDRLGPDVTVEVIDVGEYHLEEMEDFDFLILGISTWNVGQLQADWERAFDDLETLDLSNKRAALFGLGDQVGYPETFVDAMFFLADKLRTQGATLIGRWPTDGYEFEASWAVEEEHFLGLVLDEHSQAHLTAERVATWCNQLWYEVGLLQEEAVR